VSERGQSLCRYHEPRPRAYLPGTVSGGLLWLIPQDGRGNDKGIDYATDMGNLSMHTFIKLPTNKPGKVKASINKDNFSLCPKYTGFFNRLLLNRLLAASDAPRRELNLLSLSCYFFRPGFCLFHNLY